MANIRNYPLKKESLHNNAVILNNSKNVRKVCFKFSFRLLCVNVSFKREASYCMFDFSRVCVCAGAQSWTCRIQTWRNTLPIWTSWWRSSLTALCEWPITQHALGSPYERASNASLFPQEVILLPAAAVSELQVPDARPAERDEGARRAETSAAPRLLQHTQGQSLTSHSASTVKEPIRTQNCHSNWS